MSFQFPIEALLQWTMELRSIGPVQGFSGLGGALHD